jgi:hypothetical protein
MVFGLSNMQSMAPIGVPNRPTDAGHRRCEAGNSNQRLHKAGSMITLTRFGLAFAFDSLEDFMIP